MKKTNILYSLTIVVFWISYSVWIIYSKRLYFFEQNIFTIIILAGVSILISLLFINIIPPKYTICCFLSSILCGFWIMYWNAGLYIINTRKLIIFAPLTPIIIGFLVLFLRRFKGRNISLSTYLETIGISVLQTILYFYFSYLVIYKVYYLFD